MAAPFSKIDFILILNFMENELKSKDEIIETLKKYKQCSQSNETKYGKIGPGRGTSRTHMIGMDKNYSSNEEDGYGVDPITKLNKLINSHRIITDGIQCRLLNISDLCREISDDVAYESMKKGRYEDESPLDQLVFDVHSLNRQLENLKQASHSATMRLQECREMEILSRIARKETNVLAKLISGRSRLASDMTSKCQEINNLEDVLMVAKSKSKQLDKTLQQLVECVCEPTNQKRPNTEEMSREMNRLLVKVKCVEDQNSRLLNKLPDFNRQQHLYHQPLEKENSLTSTSPRCRPTSETALNLDPPVKSPMHQQAIHGPHLSSMAVGIPQFVDKILSKPSLTHLGSQPEVLCNNKFHHQKETGKPAPQSEGQTSVCSSTSIARVRDLPSRNTPSKVISINIVAGARVDISRDAQESTHFRILDDDNSNRQKQTRLLSERFTFSSTPSRWPTSETGPCISQHSDGRTEILPQQKHLHSLKPNRFPAIRLATPSTPVSITSAFQGRSQKVNQLASFKPVASTTASNKGLPSSSFS